MKGPFPKNIRKVGIFPLCFGFQAKKFQDAMLERLDAWGVPYVMPKPRLPEFRYMAAPDEERARIFNDLLADESIDFLFALRGGFGAARTLKYIDWDLLLKRNIPVAGFSDMTAFLLAAYGKGFRNGICGVMAEATFGVVEPTPRHLAQAIRTMRQVVEGAPLATPCHGRRHALTPGKVTAPVTGGNLMVMDALIGTPWMPDLSGTILVLEGIKQNAVEIDRMLTQFRDCGILKSLAGIVFGTFSGCPDKHYLPELFREYSAEVPGPSFSGLPFGHDFPSAAFREGQMVTLEVTADGQCTIGG